MLGRGGHRNRESGATPVSFLPNRRVTGLSRQAAEAKHRQVRRGTRVNTRHEPTTGGSPSTNLPMLRTSERSTLKSCEWKWYLTYERRVKPQVDMPALRFGTLIHVALAAWYIKGVKRGEHPAIAFERLYEAELAETQQLYGARAGEDDKWVSAGELGPAMLSNYVDQYGKDDRYEVLVTEHPFQWVMPNFIYTGVVDGVWRDRSDKSVWIPDHKSAASISDSKLNYLQLDDQAGAYWSFGVMALKKQGLLKQDQKLRGMLYNFLRKQMPDERQSKILNGKRVYLNLDGSVSKKQPSPYFMRVPIYRDEHDKEMTMARAAMDAERIAELRSGARPVGKTPGQFTCPMCPMLDACELHETGNDWEGFLQQTTKQWDPYAEHEVYDGR